MESMETVASMEAWPDADNARPSDHRPYWFPKDNLRHSRKMSDLGFGGSGGHFYCRIILLHFGLVTFRFLFGKTRQVMIFMFFGPSGGDHDSPNQYYSSLEAPRYYKKIKKTFESFFKHIMFEHIISSIDVCGQIPNIRLCF